MFADLLISGYMLVALNTPSIFPLRNVGVEEPAISAKAALVFDVGRERVLYQKGGEEVLPMASLTKLLSSLVVLESIPLDKIVTLDERAIETLGGAGDFRVGEQVEARHLLFASLIQSSNDAVMALAYDLGLENFLKLMRSKLIQLGLEETVVSDPAGLSLRTKSSPFDLVKIARAAFQNEFISHVVSIPEYTFRSASGRYHRLVSTNNLIFDPRIIAAKTGFLNEVGQNYAALVSTGERREQRLLVVIMGSENRTSDMHHLLNWLDQGFLWK